ncbi:MAG: hypothetical protein CYG60_19020 [Actinobacteria bacterium]|nr:MAG: hypothetical protein CYG60_19020 [Actinomycetota bacterium]
MGRDVVSQAGQELGISLLAVALFGPATHVAIREGSEAWAWISAAAFLASSLLAAWWLWRQL